MPVGLAQQQPGKKMDYHDLMSLLQFVHSSQSGSSMIMLAWRFNWRVKYVLLVCRSWDCNQPGSSSSQLEPVRGSLVHLLTSPSYRLSFCVVYSPFIP